MTVIDEVAAGRRLHDAKGWTTAHDDGHVGGEMAGAAACYILSGLRVGRADLNMRLRDVVQDLWPWKPRRWTLAQRRSDLVKAAALIVAEIERMDRQRAEHAP